MLVIKKADLEYNENNGEIKQPFVAIQDFKTSFIDFGTDNDNLQNIMNKPPIWLQEQFTDNVLGMSNYLKKKVWIRMYKRPLFAKRQKC